MSPASRRQRKAPSKPAYGSNKVHLDTATLPIHNAHNLWIKYKINFFIFKSVI